MFDYRTCSMCGKKFIRQPLSIYKLSFANRSYQFCSYTCYSEALRVRDSAHPEDYRRFQKELNINKELQNGET